MQYQFIKSLRRFTLRNDTGSVYIVGLIFIFLTAVFVAGILLITSIEYRHVIRDQWSLTALHLAEAGVDDAMWAIKNSNWAGGWNITGNPYTKTVSSFSDSTGTVIGSYYVAVTNPSSITPSIESTGYSPSMSASDKIERTVSISTGPDTSNIIAAITTNYNTDTGGSLTVDGRNHEINDPYNVIADSGTLGIYTTGDYDRDGSSTVGGTDGTDSPPSTTYNPPNIVTEAGTWAGGYPATPDEVMNYAPGTLKTKALSGVGGSQYVTSSSLLTTPLSGVTYVEISDEWQPAGSFDLSGTGVLVVHSTTGNTSTIKNLNTGTFKGLIIADDVVHIHTDIIGAVFTLSSNPSSGNCIGNGNGRVLYSSQAINNAFNATASSGDAVILTWQEK